MENNLNKGNGTFKLTFSELTTILGVSSISRIYLYQGSGGERYSADYLLQLTNKSDTNWSQPSSAFTIDGNTITFNMYNSYNASQVSISIYTVTAIGY